MTLIGHTMMCEQTGPEQLVLDVALAEEVGFGFAVISDQYFPWLEAKATPRTHGRARRGRPGDPPHSPDGVCHCPICRYHPAVVA
jgi:hypothetical protein